MPELNSAQAALSQWMRPPVARGWLAQITRYTARRAAFTREAGSGAFRALLNRDWVKLDIL